MTAANNFDPDSTWDFGCEICGITGRNFDDGRHHIACDSCGHWQHTVCHGFAAVQAESIQFKCKKCKQLTANIKKPVPAVKQVTLTSKRAVPTFKQQTHTFGLPSDCAVLLEGQPHHHVLNCGHMVRSVRALPCAINCRREKTTRSVTISKTTFVCAECNASTPELRGDLRGIITQPEWLYGLPGNQAVDTHRRASGWIRRSGRASISRHEGPHPLPTKSRKFTVPAATGQKSATYTTTSRHSTTGLDDPRASGAFDKGVWNEQRLTSVWLTISIEGNAISHDLRFRKYKHNKEHNTVHIVSYSYDRSCYICLVKMEKCSESSTQRVDDCTNRRLKLTEALFVSSSIASHVPQRGWMLTTEITDEWELSRLSSMHALYLIQHYFLLDQSWKPLSALSTDLLLRPLRTRTAHPLWCSRRTLSPRPPVPCSKNTCLFGHAWMACLDSAEQARVERQVFSKSQPSRSPNPATEPTCFASWLLRRHQSWKLPLEQTDHWASIRDCYLI